MKFLLAYLNIKTYILISLIIFIFTLIISYLKPIDVDISEIFKKLNEAIDELKKSNEKLGNIMENVLNQALEGNKMPLLICIFFFCLLPFIRFVFLYSSIKDFFKTMK